MESYFENFRKSSYFETLNIDNLVRAKHEEKCSSNQNLSFAFYYTNSLFVHITRYSLDRIHHRLFKFRKGLKPSNVAISAFTSFNVLHFIDFILSF